MLDFMTEADSFVAPAGCVTWGKGRPTILHCFPAHQTKLTPDQKAAMDQIALLIDKSHEVGKPIRKVRIVGHAAKWRGISEGQYLSRSRARAKFAAAQLRSMLDAIRPGHGVRITTSGRGTLQELLPSRPESTSKTARRARSLNRRVEIFVTPAAKKGKPKPSGPPRSNLNKALRSIRSRVAPHKRCVLDKLLDPKADHTFLPVRGVTGFLSTRLSKRGIGDHRKFYRNMRTDMEKALRRIRRVPTKASDETRLLNSFNNSYIELFDGIRALKFADCQDPRTPKMRLDLFTMRKKSKSLYHCTAPRKTMQQVIDDLAGFDGLYPEYGCAA